jgi:hypothetical protein
MVRRRARRCVRAGARHQREFEHVTIYPICMMSSYFFYKLNTNNLHDVFLLMV